MKRSKLALTVTIEYAKPTAIPDDVIDDLYSDLFTAAENVLIAASESTTALGDCTIAVSES